MWLSLPYVLVAIIALVMLKPTACTMKKQQSEMKDTGVAYLVKLFNLKGNPDKQLKNFLRDNPSNYLRGNHKHKSHYPTRNELFSILYHSNISPYSSYSPLPSAASIGESYKSHAWVHAEMIRETIRRLLGKDAASIKFVLEVGSFVGSGAIHALAPLLQPMAAAAVPAGGADPTVNAAATTTDRGGGGLVLCVDTWLGDVNMRLNPSFDKYTLPLHGTPRLYDIFLSNVIANNLEEVIFPLSMPSIVAARLLGHLHWKVDVIYIDSAHEQGETLVELILYYQLLRPGGVILGDDYVSFPGVKHDVDAFAAFVGVVPTVMGGQWFLVKTVELK